MTVTDLILACRTLLENNPPQTGCPNQRVVDNKDIARLQATLNSISIAERLQLAMEDETGRPMAYRGKPKVSGENGPPPPPQYRPDPPPAPPCNPARLTCGPVHERDRA